MNWIGAMISFAVVLQSIELFWIPKFRAETIQPEYPWILRRLVRWDQMIAAFRLAAAVLALISPSPVEVSVLLLTTWMIGMRWRGTLNGGSDIMTFHILAAWWVSLALPKAEQACVYYIAIQLILSYVVSGVVKFANPAWRNGSALRLFLNRWGYEPSPALCLALSWMTILFESSFPLAIFAPPPFMAMGAVFHLSIAYVFGLNRFFFVWLAAYPALLLLHQSV